MRTNVYAEEISDRIEIIEKTTGDGTFTGLRMYLELPVTVKICKRCGVVDQYATPTCMDDTPEARFVQIPHEWVTKQLRGPFMHHPGDDDSSAVTFWGKRDLRDVLKVAITKLNRHYNSRTIELELSEEDRQMVLLALAVLSLESPGFDWTLNEIAKRIDNVGPGPHGFPPRAETYDKFREARRKPPEEFPPGAPRR